MVGRSPHPDLLPLKKENAFQRLGNGKRWVHEAWRFGDPGSVKMLPSTGHGFIHRAFGLPG